MMWPRTQHLMCTQGEIKRKTKSVKIIQRKIISIIEFSGERGEKRKMSINIKIFSLISKNVFLRSVLSKNILFHPLGFHLVVRAYSSVHIWANLVNLTLKPTRQPPLPPRLVSRIMRRRDQMIPCAIKTFSHWIELLKLFMISSKVERFLFASFFFGLNWSERTNTRLRRSSERWWSDVQIYLFMIIR